MTDLFQSLDDLKPFIFRIMDNGGATADRFTIVTCDGDYFAYSTNPCAPQGVGLTGEGIDVQVLADWEESGEARDLRWIDLPEACRRAVMDSLNYGFSDWIESERCADNRDAADDFDGTWRPNMWKPENPIYRDGDVFRVRDDERRDHHEYGVTGDEPFATFREAVLRILPEDYTLAGPEYHTPLDLWDETGGPQPLWDCEAEPPTPWEVRGYALDDSTVPHSIAIGEARDETHAREVVAEWRRLKPTTAALYRPALGLKTDRTFHSMD